MSEQAAGPRKPTIRTVAERAGVSLKTVSRVINNEPSVLPATRARVLQTIAELDYEPDPSARNLRSAILAGRLNAFADEALAKLGIARIPEVHP